MTRKGERPATREPQVGRARIAVSRVAVAITCLLTFAACSSEQDRAQSHLERGREFFAQGNRDAALIEFENARRADPGNSAASVELGEIAIWEHNLENAKFYFLEAARSAPDDPRIQANLALVIRHEDPPRARKMIDELLERKPEFPLAHAAASQIAQSEGKYRQGLENAKRAVELDPDESDFHWNLGLSYTIMISHRRALRKTVEDSDFDAAQRAFDRYVETGGQPVWTARIEQAIIASAQPNHGEEAIAAARRALEATSQTSSRRGRYRAAELLARVAQRESDRGAHAEALEAFIALNPRDLVAWSSLATARAKSGESADAVYGELLEQNPGDIEAHALYAGYLMRTQGVQSGLQYFRNQARTNSQPAAMLAALHSAQVSTQSFREAKQTLEEMKREHPDHAWTIVAVARDDFRHGRTRRAATKLRQLIRQEKFSAALLLLARVELSQKSFGAALGHAREANRMANRFDPLSLLAVGETSFAAGEFEEALKALKAYSARVVVKDEQKVLLAKAYYETGDPHLGREILRELAERPLPNVEALVEWAQRDRNHPMGRDRLRAALENGMKSNPKGYRILTQLVMLDFEAGQRGVALQRLDDKTLYGASVNLVMLRAILRFDQGNLNGAYRDATRAFYRDPGYPRVVELLVALHAERGSGELEIQRMQERMRVDDENGPGGDVVKRSWNHLLLARLLTESGREEEAIQVLQQAKRNHEAVPDLMIDLSYLYARKGERLEEAEQMANLAIDRGVGGARAHDTLGFVLLQREDRARAIEQFRIAIKNADQPQPLYHYHLCVALDSVGQQTEALAEIETVLRLDPQYPDALEIRNRLRSALENHAETPG